MFILEIIFSINNVKSKTSGISICQHEVEEQLCCNGTEIIFSRWFKCHTTGGRGFIITTRAFVFICIVTTSFSIQFQKVLFASKMCWVKAYLIYGDLKKSKFHSFFHKICLKIDVLKSIRLCEFLMRWK